MRKLLKIKFLIFLISLSFGGGCLKHTPIPDEPEPISGCIEAWCEDFPQAPELGFAYTSDGAQYEAPFFNPNNPNEFIYLRTGIVSNTELIKYNLLTKQEEVLCNSLDIVTPPKWGRQGWIVFTVLGNRIWKIKDDGTQLTQLTFYNSLYPIIGYDGNYFSAGGLHPEISDNDLFRPIMNMDGDLVDSFQYVFGNIGYGIPCQINDNEFNEGYFSFFDFDSPPSQSIMGFSKKNDSSTFIKMTLFINKTVIDASANSNYLFYSEYWGKLRRIDLTTYETSAYRWGCKSRYYHHLSISPNGDKMLVQKVISKPYDNNTAIDVQNEIWLVDVNGCVDEKILGE